MLDLSVFYLNFGRPHNPDLVKFIVHLDNFSRVFATQACFLSFEQLYRVWGSVFSKESAEQESLMPKLSPLERKDLNLGPTLDWSLRASLCKDVGLLEL